MSGPFSPDALAKSVHDTLGSALTAIPSDKSHALLVDASRDEGVRALFVERVGDGWTVALEGAWTGGSHVNGKVTAIKTW